MDEILKLRVDKWLWAARFYKTRALAQDELGKGRVLLNGDAVKAARELKVGDTLAIRQGEVIRTVVVRALSGQRGPAPVAQLLYEETAQSLAARELARQQRRYHAEPALAISAGRPTKAQRRALDKVGVDWGKRWNASYDGA